ncbi:TPA: helix-turn-helix domain-containing protein, partial [Klebsiella pneumoniae]|nr:helix-turn-helix domain-containing protein [Klebsiella pneumoniae]
VREIKGFKNILLSPWTLSDVTIEWDYWESVLRHRYKTQNGDGYVQIIWDRRGWLTDLLCVMKPVTRAEALTVCKWLLACDYFEERDSLFDRIILNLVGECEE